MKFAIVEPVAPKPAGSSNGWRSLSTATCSKPAASGEEAHAYAT
jgi:hypothetical protein